MTRTKKPVEPKIADNEVSSWTKEEEWVPDVIEYVELQRTRISVWLPRDAMRALTDAKLFFGVKLRKPGPAHTGEAVTECLLLWHQWYAVQCARHDALSKKFSPKVEG